VAECGGEVVGFVSVGPAADADLDASDCGEIRAIYLKPDRWRGGIGRLLCKQGERVLRSEGYRSAILWVLEGNAGARRFYEAMGYHGDGGRKTATYGVPLEVVRYRKTLEPLEPGAVR
jgi:GNAT superfamily N-acetyltransferase